MELSKLMELSNKPAASTTAAEVKVDELEPKPPSECASTCNCGPAIPGEIIASAVYPGTDRADKRVGPTLRSNVQPGPRHLRREVVASARRLGAIGTRAAATITASLGNVGWAARAWQYLEPSRPKRVFDDMKFAADLAPGGMLVLGSLTEPAGQPGPSFLHRKRRTRRAKAPHHPSFANPARRAIQPAGTAQTGSSRHKKKQTARGRHASCTVRSCFSRIYYSDRLPHAFQLAGRAELRVLVHDVVGIGRHEDLPWRTQVEIGRIVAERLAVNGAPHQPAVGVDVHLADAHLGRRQILFFGTPLVLFILPPALLMRSTHSFGTLLDPCITRGKFFGKAF